MKRTLQSYVLLSLAAACGSCNDAADDVVGADAAVAPFDYQPFTPRTRSLGLAGSHFQLSLTDTIGPIACGLSQDHHSGLGTLGHQILADVGSASGTPCPTGTHSLRSDCPTQLDFLPYVSPGCAYYRRYDQQGQSLGMRSATAGAINVTGDEDSCTFTVNLSFSGQAYADTFTLTNGLTASPWCKQ